MFKKIFIIIESIEKDEERNQEAVLNLIAQGLTLHINHVSEEDLDQDQVPEKSPFQVNHRVGIVDFDCFKFLLIKINLFYFKFKHILFNEFKICDTNIK